MSRLEKMVGAVRDKRSGNAKGMRSKKPDTRRCEGWERHGGMMTLGPVVWTRCTAKPTHVVVFRRKAEDDCSACAGCLQKLKTHNGQGTYRVATVAEYVSTAGEAGRCG